MEGGPAPEPAGGRHNGATDRRQAWAGSRDSWQASEEEPPAAVTQHRREPKGRPRGAAGAGHAPNEIETWLMECRTPPGSSLDEQSNPKGIHLKNGGSFEDDLSLGAEADGLLNGKMGSTCNGMLAEERRRQFYQKGRSMNSTGSGKSSTTVSSVSELLDLYDEDPEEILYNLGFGRDEPDIAAKIPPRFFNDSSYARGIDIKVFLNAQMQRLEVENPNFALTSRFRQIEVLTTVANAFSDLYSQVSGTPLQKIGSTSFSVNKDTTTPAPLKRTPSTSLLQKTVSRLHLLAAQPCGESSTSTTSPTNENKEPTNVDPKLQNLFKKRDSPLLATVKEEAGHIPVMDALNVGIPSQETSTTVGELTTDVDVSGADEHTGSRLGECSSIEDSSVLDMSLQESLENQELKTENPKTSTPEKEPCVIMNPSIVNLMAQQRQDSYEMEEIQSTEGEWTHGPSICQLARQKLAKDYFSEARTASQHSDSSGFAEDPSSDYLSGIPPQVPDFKAMGTSADSCDSENTVTSNGDEIMTPIGRDKDFKEYEEFLTPCGLAGQTFFPGPASEDPDKYDSKLINTSEDVEKPNSHDPFDQPENEGDIEDNGLATQHECAEESDLENSISEVVPYITHHISKTTDYFSDSMEDKGSVLGYSKTSPLERITVALQRAQMKVCTNSEISGTRVGRSMITAKDLQNRRIQYAESGYPLRRTQSLPTALLSPVRVVSSVSVRLSSGKATLCSPPSFTYRYTPEEEEEDVEVIKENKCVYESTHFPPPPVKKDNSGSSDGINRYMEDQLPNRSQTCLHREQSPRSHSSCSLHSVHSDWQDRPLCDHARAWSTQSVPGICGASCNALASPFGCHYSQRLGGHPRTCSDHVSVNAPSAIEMQLRRVLHDIRNSLQNLNQYPVMRGTEVANTSFTPRLSVLPLYENTFHELQVMRRSLNLFRTQMMDLEMSMLRQQTMVYHQLTEEERFEADQLQGLRNSVRMELQELELQLEERLLFLEEQLRMLHMSSPYRPQPLTGMYGSRSTDNVSYTSSFNVMEPVTELIKEQSYLKSELALSDNGMETGAEGTESVCSRIASDASSVCSSHSQRSRKSRIGSSDQIGKGRSHSPHNKPIYRASVALTPTPPLRAGTVEQPRGVEYLEEHESLTLEAEKRPSSSAAADNGRTAAENEQLQQVIREIKESIVGDIRREIVSGLLAAVTSPARSADGKHDGKS